MVKKADFNTKITEIEGEVPNVSSLTKNSALKVVESKIPDVSSLVKRTDCNTKISEIENKVNNHNHDKYITTPEFNTMAATVFKARLAAETDLIRKPDFDSRLKKISDRVTKNKTKLFLVENELKKLQTLESSYFLCRSYFDGTDGAQNSLVFQVGEKYFKNNSGSNSSKISIWKSKGLFSQSLSLSGTVGTGNDIKMSNPIRPAYVILNHKESFFEQNKENIIKSGSIVKICIVYSLSQKTIDSDNALKTVYLVQLK